MQTCIHRNIDVLRVNIEILNLYKINVIILKNPCFITKEEVVRNGVNRPNQIIPK